VAGVGSKIVQLLRRGRPLLGLALFVVALVVLHRQLKAHSLDEIRESLASIPYSAVALALGLTVVSYLTLTGFDALALRHIGKRLAYARIAVTSFVATVFSLDLGLNVVGSSAIRYRLYSSWGLSLSEVGTVVAFAALTFFVGILAFGGTLLSVVALPIPDAVRLPLETTRPIGFVLLTGLAAYAFVLLRRQKPIRVHDIEVKIPGKATTLAQIALASADWVLASAVLWVLLPSEGRIDFGTFIAIFMAAQILALASTVPAGLGVFEGLIIALLSASHSTPDVIGSLLVYRIIYYLLPIFGAVGILGTLEALKRREALGRVRDWAARLGSAVTAPAMGLAMLVAGLWLLAAAFIPPAAREASLLRLPLPVLEVSHALSAVTGLALVLLSAGIRRRVDAAWSASLGVLVIAAAASLAIGSHAALAGALALLALASWACRAHFDRPSSLLAARLPGEWTGLIAVALLGAVWLGVWSSTHEGPLTPLWTRFHPDAHAARGLRAAGLVAMLWAGFAAWQLARPQRASTEPAGPEELERAGRIVAGAQRADAHLALLGDKCLLFDAEDEDAVLMYATSGRSWISMGDPIGAPESRRSLAWQFRELTEQQGASAVFYEVGPEDLPTYLDLGLSIHKLGETARVPLENFSLEGSRHKGMRQVVRHCERDGARFEVVGADDVAPLLGELEAISNAWLSGKSTREKGFSLGAFHRDYLLRNPVALVRIGDAPVAFTNLWMGASGGEIAPDMMRYDPQAAPASVMEYLFIQSMLYGTEAGYRWFSLGMAPLSGLSTSPLAPAWNRVGGALYRHGEHFYNFQGLRRYKEKFHPVWEPRYLASPGGLSLPSVLARIAALVSGGVRGALSR